MSVHAYWLVVHSCVLPYFSIVRSSKTANTFPHAKNSTVISPQDVTQCCESDDDNEDQDVQDALYDEVPGEEEDGSENDTPYEHMQEEPHYDSVPQESHSDDEHEEEYE